MSEKRFSHIGCCVHLNGDSINEMKDDAVSVSLKTLRRHCEGIDDWITLMGYEKRRNKGLTIADDFYVEFFKSKYQDAPCYFISHSAIEHVWALNGKVK